MSAHAKISVLLTANIIVIVTFEIIIIRLCSVSALAVLMIITGNVFLFSDDMSLSVITTTFTNIMNIFA